MICERLAAGERAPPQRGEIIGGWTIGSLHFVKYKEKGKNYVNRYSLINIRSDFLLRSGCACATQETSTNSTVRKKNKEKKL